jgi:hypothetical protein
MLAGFGWAVAGVCRQTNPSAEPRLAGGEMPVRESATSLGAMSLAARLAWPNRPLERLPVHGSHRQPRHSLLPTDR